MLGVASVALWAAGCARPEPSADPISRWEFDETSSAEGFFEDRGPAHVLMVLDGLWPDLTTGSMVEGDDGTSAYTDGSAYATIPADVPAYNLAAITISFYYQRESAADKQSLLAAGNGSQAGDFSIEVLPNGRLRGWHTGQDGVLRFFESTNGITGTDLQVGTAHRIELTLGAQGARLYLDGAELAAAAIPANTNGWNNTRVKYLGRWIDGAQAPAVGVFDRLRIWNRQLSGAKIAQLEAAQSITLPDEPEEPGQPGEALAVPSLAEWLPSDEIDPVPTKYVSNQNRGNGSGSGPANAQEVQAALDDADPGDVLLAVCQTPGTIEFWDYPSGLSFPSGAAGNHITLQAREGNGVVINAGQAYGGARTPDSGFWTQSGLSSDDISKQIWRSASTFPGGSQGMIGTWVEFDHPHQIIPAGSMANLRTAYGTADSFTNYAGPCAHQDSDGRLYIRFQRPHPGKYSVGGTYRSYLWPKNPEAVDGSGQIVYPISQNPNNYVINIAKQSPGNLHFIRGGPWFKIGSGINSCGFRRFAAAGTSNIATRRGTHLVWQGVAIGPGSGLTENWDCQRTRWSDGSKRHLSRAEWKFGGPLEGIRSFFIGVFARCKNLNFLNCTIADFHEIGVGGAPPNNTGWTRWRNCVFFNILDDGIQARTELSRIEFGYCFFLDSAYGGNGVNGSEGPDPNPGEWLVHHNVFDARVQKCDDWRVICHPLFLWGSHSPDNNQPRKNYNNTILYGPDPEGLHEHGLYHNHNKNNTAVGTAGAHEVFNNIVIRHDTQRYDLSAHTSPGTGFRDGVATRISCDADLSNEYWDFNLYYRDLPECPGGGFQHQLMYNIREGAGSSGDAGVNQQSFANIAAFKASSLFTMSKNSGSRRGAYSPGFENSGSSNKPTLPSIDNFPARRFEYRPSPTAEVTVATSSSLSGANWWSTLPSWGDDYFSWSAGGGSLAPSGWKGALDPNGSMITVGVLDP